MTIDVVANVPAVARAKSRGTGLWRPLPRIFRARRRSHDLRDVLWPQPVVGCLPCPLALDRQRRPSGAIPGRPFIPAGTAGKARSARPGARRAGIRSVDHQLRHRGLDADLPSVRIVVAERRDLVAGPRRDAASHGDSLRCGMDPAREIDVRRGNHTADRIAGLVGGREKQDACPSAIADARAVSPLPPADLRVVRDHALDSADLDAGPIGAGDRSHRLLPGRASLQGGAFLTLVRARIRSLPRTSSLLASHSSAWASAEGPELTLRQWRRIA